MKLFLATSLVYILSLLFITPAPSSLRAAKPTLYQNFLGIRATLASGLLLLAIFFVTSNFGFWETDERVYEQLTLRGGHGEQDLWPLTVFTHLFLHVNLVHLLANVFSIGLASLYERRVGLRRFITVLLISSIASIPSAFFYSPNYAICGISGGVSGLAAAYFTDQEGMSIKEWIQAIVFFTFVFAMLSISEAYKTHGNARLSFQVDHIGHILGAVAAILYCRMASQKGLTGGSRGQ